MNTVRDKMRDAQETLRKRLEKASRTAGRRCKCKLDRLQGTCNANPAPALKKLAEFRSISSKWVKLPKGGQFQAYGRAHWFWHRSSGMKFSIDSERRKPWLAPYRIIMYGDDKTGLLPEEVFPVLEVLPDFKLSMIELAFDFLGGR